MFESPYEGRPAGPRLSQRRVHVPGIIAIVVTVFALAVPMAACSRPTAAPTPAAPATPQFTEQQVGDAKKAVCDAYEMVYRAVEKAGTTISEDPNQKYMIGLNTRLAFNTSADYLLSTLMQNPAIQSDLSDAVHKVVVSYQRMVLAQTADSSKDKLDSVYAEVGDTDAALKTACE